MLVTNIQRFSLHDGPGIRTTVFLKGCSLRCPWCSNPENLLPVIQKYRKDGQEGVYGVAFNADELYTEVIRDRAFYIGEIKDYQITQPEQLDRLPGGVTFSGGECLLYMKELSPLMSRLNQEHIHIAVETSLFVPMDALKLALQMVDLFYVDVKILDPEKVRKQLHGDLALYLANFKKLLDSGKPVVIRLPVIGGYTDGEENREQISEWIASHLATSPANILKIELIQEHSLGLSKYRVLSACNEDFTEPIYQGVAREVMEQYRTTLLHKINGRIPVDICCI